MTTNDAGAAALFEKFGTYILPGRVSDPRRGIDEAKEAERLGLGAVWISERYASKEPAVLSGAVSEATNNIRIVCGSCDLHLFGGVGAERHEKIDRIFIGRPYGIRDNWHLQHE